VLYLEYQTRKSIVECGFSVQNTLRDHFLLSRLLYGIQLWTAFWRMQCLVIHFTNDIRMCGHLACPPPPLPTMALGPVSGSWPHLSGVRNYTHWTHRIR